MPHPVVLINQKLGGYWEVTVDNLAAHPEGFTRVIRFDKGKKADRKVKSCTLTWMYVDSAAIYKRKLNKSIKKVYEILVDSVVYQTARKLK